MGQSRYGRLPKSQNWVQVVSLLSSPETNAAQIAAATVRACRYSLKRHAGDPVLVRSLYLLIHFPLSAKQGRPTAFLRDHGINPQCLSSTATLIAETGSYLYKQNFDNRDPSFVSDVAIHCFQETLTKLASKANLSLFAETADQLQEALASSATPRGFAAAAKEYFTAFMLHTLLYFLSKESVNNLGPTERFESLESVHELSRELEAYCRESSVIIHSFAEQWYSKYKWQQKLDLQSIENFTRAALRKFSVEIGREQTFV